MLWLPLAPFLIIALALLWQQSWARVDAFCANRERDDRLAGIRAYAAARPDDLLAQERLGEALATAGYLDEAHGVLTAALAAAQGQTRYFSGDIHFRLRQIEREQAAHVAATTAPRPRYTARPDAIWIVGLLVGVGLATFHLVGDRNPNTALSFALGALNPVAWGTLAAVAGVLGLLARRLWERAHRFRTAVLLLNAPALALIAVTDPTSAVHLGAFFGAMLLSTLWLCIAYLDAGELLSVGLFVGIMVLGGLLFIWSPGLSERLMLTALTIAACWHHSAHLTHDNEI